MSDSRPIPLLPPLTSEPAELVTAILKRRGGGGLLKLDRMLLHSVPLCEGWNAFFGKVRGGSCKQNRNAVTNARAGARWAQHLPAPQGAHYVRRRCFERGTLRIRAPRPTVRPSLHAMY